MGAQRGDMTMLNLSSDTAVPWLPAALANLDDVLLDHANCEKKAASMAVNFLFRYPDKPEFLIPLSSLAREELRHYELVIGLLERRQIPLRRMQPSGYAGRLIKVARKAEPARCMDLMLCASLIEARSCERMKLLHEAFSSEGESHDSELARLYGGLLASEARHHHTYVELCTALFGREDTRARLAELSVLEAEIIATATGPARMHS